MRICIDLDGVICRLREPGQQYADLEPVPGAIEKLRQLRAAGHTIIISTARHMKTCQGNVGLVLARQGAVTLDWLKRHGIEYDEIHFGKPHAQVYIDDNALRFADWNSIAGDGSTLPTSTEHQAEQQAQAEKAVMNIVMPMAGRGSRFAQIGIETPKPLIDVRGKPMYAWATDGLPLALARRLIFICLREHLDNLALERDIKSRYERFDPAIIALDEVTQGQACTVLVARAWIDNDDPLLIFNADTYCPTNLADALQTDCAGADGIIDVFSAAGDKWSFARTDEQNRVLETAEKRRISPWATTGLYYFRRGRDFVTHADAMIAADERSNREFYVAPVYNRMIAAGADIRANRVEHVWVLGTPEDLAHFEREYPR